jgi:hypothetical protein
MSVDFRRATIDDLASLEGLLHAFTVEDLHPWDPGVVAAAVGLMERPYHGMVVVAHDAARLVGYERLGFRTQDSRWMQLELS